MITQEQRDKLFAAGKDVHQRAYAPYSHYHVGAALLTSEDEIITGCNMENAVYPASICAERSAVVKAVSEGKQDKLVGIAVVTENGGTPCGVCRQVLYEFNPQMTVLIYNLDGELVTETTVEALLPSGFGVEYLPSS